MLSFSLHVKLPGVLVQPELWRWGGLKQRMRFGPNGLISVWIADNWTVNLMVMKGQWCGPIRSCRAIRNCGGIQARNFLPPHSLALQAHFVLPQNGCCINVSGIINSEWQIQYLSWHTITTGNWVGSRTDLSIWVLVCEPWSPGIWTKVLFFRFPQMDRTAWMATKPQILSIFCLIPICCTFKSLQLFTITRKEQEQLIINLTWNEKQGSRKNMSVFWKVSRKP